jgi:hypothetical protein
MNKLTISDKDTSSITGAAILQEFIHRSAWKKNSAKLNFCFTAFYEVHLRRGFVTFVVTLGRRRYCRVGS